MGGTAVLDQDVLVDSLVADVIDGLRDDLHPQFGVRPYRVYTVKRTWSGEVPGDGDATDVTTELTPQPLVLPEKLEHRREPAGLDEAEAVWLREVSLSYTEDEITGGTLARNVEWLIKVAEAYGQGTRTRWFVIDQPPTPDRTKDMGWAVRMRRAGGG